MNIYKVSQNENTDYDTYDSFVCYAATLHQARSMSPDGNRATWCSPDKTEAVYLGSNKYVTEAIIILTSFNAG